MSPLRLGTFLLLASLLVASLVACAAPAPPRLDEAQYLEFRARFTKTLLENDKASQRAAMLPADQSNRELTRLAAADDALAAEAEALVPPLRWRKHRDLLVTCARSFAAAMRDFAAVAVTTSRDSTAVSAGTANVVRGQQAFDAAEAIYRDLVSQPPGEFE